MFIRQTIIAAVLAFISADSVLASELPKLSVTEAIQLGLKQNHKIQAAGFMADAAQAEAASASLHYLPSITAEESWIRSNMPVNTFMMKLNQGRFTQQDFEISKLNDPSPIGDFRTSITIEQPLLAPKAWAADKVASLGAEQQKLASRLTKEQIAFQIFLQYLEVQKAHARLETARTALEEAEESRRQARVRTTAGLGLKSDELRAATHLAGMEQQMISAENNLILARLQLGLAIGADAGEEFETEAVRFEASNKAELEQLLHDAQQTRLDIKVAEQGKDRADAAVWQARSDFLPTVGAIGSWQMNHNRTPFGKDHDSWMLGVALRWNIFDGLRTVHGSRQASASQAAAGQQLEQTRKEISYQVQEAWLRKQEATKHHQVAQAALEAAEEATRILSRRFDNALATMVELLDARTALNQARANLVESEAASSRATGYLYHVTGTFLKEVH